MHHAIATRPRKTAPSSALQAMLLGSSDTSEARAEKVAQFDAQLAHLDRLIAVAEIATAAAK